MSLEQIQQFHHRYLVLSDQFKCLWTLNQVLQGVYKHLLGREVPYKVDFRALYNQIRGLPPMFSNYQPVQVEGFIAALEKEVAKTFETVDAADAAVSPSDLRRFFEAFKDEEEDKVILQIIKYFIHLQKINQDIRDKLDFLITRIAGIHSESERKFILRDREYLKELFQKLMAIGKLPPVDAKLKEQYIMLMQEMRSEVVECKSLEDFVLSGVLKAIRSLKSTMGLAFLHPDILVKIAELNITTKNRYLEIYLKEEASLLEETTRVKSLKLKLESETPEMQRDLKRVEELEQAYERAKEKGDVKLEIMAQYKKATRAVLNQLEADFTFIADEESAVPPPGPGRGEEALDDDAILGGILSAPGIKVEAFERPSLDAYGNLRRLAPLQDLDRLVLRGLAHRARIEILIDPLLKGAGDAGLLDRGMLERAHALVKAGEELEKDIQYAIEDALFQGGEAAAQQLLRAKYRLLRSLSGLWLLLDRLG
jgi:hypothetical protein